MADGDRSASATLAFVPVDLWRPSDYYGGRWAVKRHGSVWWLASARSSAKLDANGSGAA